MKTGKKRRISMTAKEKIYKWIEENREEVTGLLQKLIQAPSVNPY